MTNQQATKELLIALELDVEKHFDIIFKALAAAYRRGYDCGEVTEMNFPRSKTEMGR